MSGPMSQQNSTRPSKKRKRSKRDTGEQERQSNARQAKPRPLSDDIDESIGHMNGTLLADLFAQRVKRHMKDLTSVEASDLQVPEQCSSGKEELSTTVETTASPHTLVICGSGIRAADIARTVRLFQSKTAAVCKLFAKHIKLAESVETVAKTKIGIGVGTPQRILDLLSMDALKTDNLRRIVIDASYLDQKKRSILDHREVFGPLIRILNQEDVRASMDNTDPKKGTRLLVF
ncbi:MAG: hypothetical protein Q9160_001467 [Pyrenula sp. 1 TL-2023]